MIHFRWKLAPFLSAKLGNRNGARGWEYLQQTLNRDQLKSIEPTSWEPEQIDLNEWVILMQLARHSELDVRDLEFRDYAKKQGFDPDGLIEGLVAKRALAWCDDHTVRLLRSDILVTGFMPDGKTVTADDTSLMSLWLVDQLEKRQKRNPKT